MQSEPTGTRSSLVMRCAIVALVMLAIASLAATVVGLIHDWPQPVTGGTVAQAKDVTPVEVAGQWGDFIGGHLAAGANLCSTLLLVLTLLLQREQLASQGRELQTTIHLYREEATRARYSAAIEAIEQYNAETSVVSPT